MVLYVISCKRNNSEEFLNIEAIIRKLGVSSAIRMCPLNYITITNIKLYI